MQPTLERAGSVSLRELIPQGRFFGTDDIQFESCCGDAYRCEPGDLFVAIDGHDGDGRLERALRARRQTRDAQREADEDVLDAVRIPIDEVAGRGREGHESAVAGNGRRVATTTLATDAIRTNADQLQHPFNREGRVGGRCRESDEKE